MFKGDYLRVLTPVTSDGITLVTVNDRIKYREDHLPLSAQKMLEKKNEKTPTSLRKKIEVVSASVAPIIKASQKPNISISSQLPDSDYLDESDNLENEDVSASAPPAKKKGGRPAKNAKNG